MYTYYWTPAREKGLDSKLGIKERKLSPFTGSSRKSIETATRLFRGSTAVEKKRLKQSKKCWDMLMRLSDKYPDLYKVLIHEGIFKAHDLIHMKISSKDRIVDTLPEGVLQDQVNIILSNFCLTDGRDDGNDSELASTDDGKKLHSQYQEQKMDFHHRNPMHRDDVYDDDVDYDPNEEKNSSEASSWDEFNMDIEDIVIQGTDSPRRQKANFNQLRRRYNPGKHLFP